MIPEGKLTTVSDLPFVSQIDPYSSQRNNDCFLACAVAITKLRLIRGGCGDIPLLHVNTLIPFTALAYHDVPLGIDNAIALLQKLGSNYKFSNSLNIPTIVEAIKRNVPTIQLGNYRYIDSTTSVDLGHFFIARAFIEDDKGTVTWIGINDSYHKGENWFIPVDKFEKCITQGGKYFGVPYQGFVE